VISRRLRPASTRMRVRSVETKTELPELLLARMQIFRMRGLLALVSECLRQPYNIC